MTQFFEVFARYNDTVWPMQIVLYIAALAILALVFLNHLQTSQVIAIILAGLWLWVGLVYHWIFFTDINALAWVFGTLFIVVATGFIWFSLLRDRLRFHLQRNIQSAIGLMHILYGLILYPLIGYFSGHHYPSTPTFGVPCPLTIFTLGILLLADPPVPTSVLVVPVLWAAIGLLAAFKLDVTQDSGLIVAAILTLAFSWRQHRLRV